MSGLCLRLWWNGCEKILFASKYFGWIINSLFCIYYQCVILKFISLINLYFFWYPRDDRWTEIKNFNYYWSMKSSHSRAALFTFILICSKRILSLVFVGSGGNSCCLDEDVHPFTYSFIISTRLLLLHLRITISPSSLLLPFIYSFIIPT